MIAGPRTPKQCWGELTTEQTSLVNALTHGAKSETAVSAALAKQLVRNTMFKGGDVRLATGSLTRPDIWPRKSLKARWWKWKVAFSFPQSGARAILKSIIWKLRSAGAVGRRHVHASDSQVCISVLVKGRSSSRQINVILHRINCLVLASSLQIAYAYVHTSLNPADAPSRWRRLRKK